MIELFRYIEHSFVPPATEDKSINVEDDSDFQNSIRRDRDQPSGDDIIRRNAEEFIQSHFSEGRSPFKLKKELPEFHAEVQRLKNPNADKVRTLIKEIFGIKAQDLVQSGNFKTDKKMLNDSILAAKLTTAYDKVNTSELVAMRQAIGFIELTVQDKLGEVSVASIKSILLRPIHVPLSLFPLRKKVQSPDTSVEENASMEEDKIRELEKKTRALETAYDALMAISADELEIGAIKNSDRPLRGAVTARENEGLADASPQTFIMLQDKTIDRLAIDVKATLHHTGIDTGSTSLPKMIATIKEKWTEAGKELHPQLAPTAPRLYQLGMHTFAIQTVPKVNLPMNVIMPDFSHAVTRPVGVGDLQVVRQELIGYEAGEVSHIENVLEGELYRRSYTRSELTEIITSEETETIQTEERDLQTTDRNEMASETQKESSKQTGTTQGQTTTTDYGKLVENSKTNFARSVTDRAVNSLTQRVKELRIRREQKSFTEQTTHEFDNSKGEKKVRGIYQWVDKKYKTRIMNYGKRLLYDIVIPEPAAFLVRSLKYAQQPESFQLIKPVEPWFAPENLNVSNYTYYAKQYGVVGAVEPPPDEFVYTVSSNPESVDVSKKIDAFGGSLFGYHYKAFVIKIPDGYKAVSGYIQRVNHHYIHSDPVRKFEFYIGEYYFVRFSTDAVNSLNHSFTMNNETGDLPVTMCSFDNIIQFNYAIGINCKRTNVALQKWQLKTYAAIMQGYRRQLAEFEDKLAQQQSLVRSQMMITKNYARNPSIEQTELKKAFIHLLISEHFGQAYFPTPNPEALPANPLYVKKWGAVVAFFERAFEWENILYYYYPYFWGRQASWGELILRQDLDPQFEEFLKAGAARVVVPVRPGFEGAMAHYHETGDVWMGEEMPDMFSELYVSIIDEIKARNYAPGEEKCITEWDIKLPTTLVMLKEDEKLPEWQPKVKCNPVDE